METNTQTNTNQSTNQTNNTSQEEGGLKKEQRKHEIIDVENVWLVKTDNDLIKVMLVDIPSSKKHAKIKGIIPDKFSDIYTLGEHKVLLSFSKLNNLMDILQKGNVQEIEFGIDEPNHAVKIRAWAEGEKNTNEPSTIIYIAPRTYDDE